MNIILKTAWKNVWRNRVRSLVVIASVTVGIFAGVFAVAFMNGMIAQRFDAAIDEEISHIQITGKDYSLNNDPRIVMKKSDGVIDAVRRVPGVERVVERTIITGMAETASKSAGIQIVGVDPAEEKEIFKLSNGKFIAPQLIENIFRESTLIDQIMVVGEHEKFASALISPNFRYFDDWKSTRNLSFTNNEELIREHEVQSFFSSEIDRLNKKLSPPERINRFRLVQDEWSPSTGELSPTLKLRRQFINEKYRDLITQVYMK